MSSFVGSTYEHRSSQLSSQKSVNLYPEIISDPFAKSAYILMPTPGTKLYAQLSKAGACRGIETVASKLDPLAPISSRTFAVFGDVLYEVGKDKTLIDRGEITNLSTRISFCDGGNYLVFCDGASMYQFEYSTNILKTIDITDVASQPTQVLFMNKRIIYINQDSTVDPIDGIEYYRRFYYSDLIGQEDITFKALSFKTFDSSADPIISMEKRQSEVILFGYGTTEIWTGAEAPSIFRKTGGSGTSIGIGAKYGSTSIQNTVAWLGASASGSNQIFVMKGYSPVAISDVTVSNTLNNIADTSDCISFSFQRNGHVFLVFTFISGDKTIVYDLTTEQWHNRSTRDPVYNTVHRWNPIYVAYGNNTLLAGNAEGNQLLELDTETYTDYSVVNNIIPIQRIRESPVDSKFMKKLFYKQFRLDCEVGVGTEALGEGNNPQLSLQFSDDGGKTWSKERWKSLGKLGQYRKRVIWNRLGSAENRVWRVATTAPVYISIFAAKTVTESSKWD